MNMSEETFRSIESKDFGARESILGAICVRLIVTSEYVRFIISLWSFRDR